MQARSCGSVSTTRHSEKNVLHASLLAVTYADAGLNQRLGMDIRKALTHGR
jgi:hypothetical protein